MFYSEIIFNMAAWENDEEIMRFREYLKIPSVQPDVDYSACVEFLTAQARLMNLPVVVHEIVPKKPVVVVTLQGLQPDLPSILLNSHMDVVPVNEELWTYPPFEAKLTDDGFIYARGSQDMKSTGMIYLEAISRFNKSGKRLKRTTHVSFVPDEEIGSTYGMKAFSESQEFKNLNVGFGMDESAPSPEPNELIVFNGERTSRQVKVTCKGEPGHGALLDIDNAGEKFYTILSKFMSLRAEEKRKTLPPINTFIGDVTTINLTQVEGGVMVNVLPEVLSATFDVRIAPDVDLDEFGNMIEAWCKEAGEGVTFEYLVKNPQVYSTKTDGSVPFWNSLVEVIEKMGLKLKCVTCPGATDARFVRLHNIPVINFTPILNTPLYVHAHNERVHADMYKKGIDIMEKVLEALANV